MSLRIFNPIPAPLCAKCDQPMGFVQLESGKWRPCNPNGSDHWDKCREVRYAEARAGECKEVVGKTKLGYTEKIVFWDGGKKPFIVRHSVKTPTPKGFVAYAGEAPPWE